MVPWTGAYTSFNAAAYVGREGIPGAIVECGVFRGGCTLLMADGLRSSGVEDRFIYLYDTFSGMSEPTELDRKGDVCAIDKHKSLQRDGHSEWSFSPLEEVAKNLKMSKYPAGHFRTIKGMVEETIPGQAPEEIAVLRLDTDWYESTLHELVHLYPRLVKGGVLIVDDYGSWEGSRKAVDEYFTKVGFRPFFFRDTTNGAICLVKPD